MSRPIEVLSVAPHFGTGSIPFAGHEEAYQLGLASAAASIGVAWTILVPERSSVETADTVRCLDPAGPDRIARSLEEFLAGREPSDGCTTCVVVYEGNVDLAAAVATLARAHPQTRFLVNLFRSEAGLEAPLVRRRSDAVAVELAPFSPETLSVRLKAIGRLEWPKNLVVTAETEQKALMARSAGIPVDGVWQLHSQMAIDAAPPSTALTHAEDASERHRQRWQVRVLVGLRSSQLHLPIVRDVIDVIDGVCRHDRESLRWVMSGRFDTDRRTRTALRRLERAGVDLSATAHDGPLANDAYARQFLAVDALWMPTAWPYRVQSSGKALDALVLGCPVIAPAGTAGARAMGRWVPGAPSYGSTTEASQLFLRLPTLIGTLREGLAASSEAIRAAYSPQATVRWVLDRVSTARVQERSGAVITHEHEHPDPSDPLLPAKASRLPTRVMRRLRREGASLARMARGLPRGLAALRREVLQRR